MFNQPQGGNYFKPKDNLGKLVVILTCYEKGTEADSLSKTGMRDFGICDVAVIDGDGQVQSRVKVTHPGLLNKFGVGSGINVLGRIGTVDTGKGNPAYVLESYTDADVKLATAWMEQYQRSMFNSPAATEVPAAPAPVAAAPAAAPEVPAALAGMDADTLAALAQIAAKAQA